MSLSRSEVTQARLVHIKETALDMIDARSVDAITMYEVAKEAQVSPSTIYYHYPNIEALFCDLQRDIFTQFSRVIDSALLGIDVRSWVDLNRAIECGFVDFYTQNRAASKLLLGVHGHSRLVQENLSNDDGLGEMIQRYYERYFHLPLLPEQFNIFTVSVQIADRLYSLAVEREGSIGSLMANEALVATEGYLSAYLPRVLKGKPKATFGVFP
ncbi:TetR/AcrR family transcriptional regulator [Vibrio breoganii]|nr:TetR/AcrR family transcriptional regulator [Vibrio breoganii]